MLDFNNKSYIIIFSIIWGIGFASLFYTICKNGNCVILRVPPEDFMKNIFYDRNTKKCYKFIKFKTEC